jgi:hypothetical protein
MSHWKSFGLAFFAIGWLLGETTGSGSSRGATTATRFCYKGMTAPGSSGAPIFNRSFRLLGLHEGRLGPPFAPDDSGKVALRADAIAGVLRVKGRLPPRWADPEAEPSA